MNSFNNILRMAGFGCATFLVALTSARAQTPAASDGTGLLGKRYIGVDLFTQDFRNKAVSTKNGYGGGIGANLPIGPNFDASFNYSYEEVRDRPLLNLGEHQAAAQITAFTRFGAIKPFASAAFGYDWTTISSSAPTVGDQKTAFYDLGAGVEFLADRLFSFDVGVDRRETLDLTTGNERSWDYTVGINYWVTPKVCAAAHVTFVGSDSTRYQLGIRVLF